MPFGDSVRGGLVKKQIINWSIILLNGRSNVSFSRYNLALYFFSPDLFFFLRKKSPVI